MDRHFLKCSYCERPLSVNAAGGEEIEFILTQKCPLCGEIALHYMGEVHKKDIVRKSLKAVCDKRCTQAVGPVCVCECNFKEHGLGRLVVFNKVVGKLEVVNKDLLADNEKHLARIKRMAEAKNKIKVKVITFLTYKNSKILNWLKETKQPAWRLAYEEYREYKKYLEFLAKIDKIEDLKSIQKKINSLSHLIPKIGDTLQYLEALSFDKEQKEQKAVA